MAISCWYYRMEVVDPRTCVSIQSMNKVLDLQLHRSDTVIDIIATSRSIYVENAKRMNIGIFASVDRTTDATQVDQGLHRRRSVSSLGVFPTCKFVLWPQTMDHRHHKLWCQVCSK